MYLTSMNGRDMWVALGDGLRHEYLQLSARFDDRLQRARVQADRAVVSVQPIGNVPLAELLTDFCTHKQANSGQAPQQP